MFGGFVFDDVSVWQVGSVVKTILEFQKWTRNQSHTYPWWYPLIWHSESLSLPSQSRITRHFFWKGFFPWKHNKKKKFSLPWALRVSMWIRVCLSFCARLHVQGAASPKDRKLINDHNPLFRRYFSLILSLIERSHRDGSNEPTFDEKTYHNHKI